MNTEDKVLVASAGVAGLVAAAQVLTGSGNSTISEIALIILAVGNVLKGYIKAPVTPS